MKAAINFKLIKPDKSLKDFVYCFSSLNNLSHLDDGVIIPNGRIDLIFSVTNKHKFQIALVGLETKPKRMPRQDVMRLFSISFNPLGIEYVFKQSVADIKDKGIQLPDDFWNFSVTDLDDFKAFVLKASRKIKSLLPDKTDERKHRLFDMIFSTNGEITINHLADELCWSQRQINRYFHSQFGLSIKAYCKILRFQASLPHIKAGQLSPQLNFTDQSHFIKEVKKLSGVSPKELSKNQNDRFLQFLAVDPE